MVARAAFAAGVALLLQLGEARRASPIDLLPDTSDGIYLFADQLNGGLSDKLVRFAATHYAGTQKLQRSENDRYREVNPRWLLLHYRLGSSSGPAQYIHGNQWTSDWTEVTAREDWFLHNENGQRHHQPGSNWDIHDLQNPEFRDYWVRTVIADMRATGAQGVFADSFEAGMSGYGVTPPDARFLQTAPANPAAWPGGVTWLQQKLDFIDYVKDRFGATPENFIFVPNITLATSWWWPRYARADGVMAEGFVIGLTPDDWALAMNRVLELTRQGKFFIAQPYPQSVDERIFAVASYLLAKGRRTFINCAGGGLHFFPEYALTIGPPLEELPSDIGAYAWKGVYKREFRDIIVLANPAAGPVTVELPQAFSLVTPIGGGEVTDPLLDDSGRFLGGALEYRDVRTLVLGPRSGALLRRK